MGADHIKTEVITRSAFRREIDFIRWQLRVKTIGYTSITRFFECEYFSQPSVTATTIAEQLNASVRTVRVKLRLFNKPIKPVDEISPTDLQKKKHVHWIFACGCEYEGRHYRPSICKTHGTPVTHRMVICQGCGETIATKVRPGAPIRFCPECIKKQNSMFKKRRKQTSAQSRSPQKEGVVKCSVPGCNNPRAKGNRFLCRKCYRTLSGEME